MTRDEIKEIKRPLYDATIKNWKPDAKRYEVLDSDGLYVVVEPSGKKVFRYFWNHRKGQFTIGEYIPSRFGLSLARKRRDEIKALLQQGIDPNAHFAELKRQEEEKKAAGIPFHEVVRQYLDWKEPRIKPGTMVNTRGRFTRHILPYLGNRIMQDMTREKDVIPFFRHINQKGLAAEAKKIRSDIKEVFDFALARDWTKERAITYGLDSLFTSTRKPRHFAAVTDPAKFGEILRRLDTYQSRAALRSVALAARLVPLVYMRREGLASLRWADIDFEQKVICKAAHEMKNGAAFDVPLSRQALAILEEAKNEAEESEYVFPSYDKRQPITGANLRRVLVFLGIPREEHTMHGFRSSAVSLIGERFGDEFSLEVREASLSHKPKVELGDTYIRSHYLEKRRQMMQKWADYCDEMKSGKYGMPPKDIWPIA